MKKLFFVMVLWFAPASAFAYDLAAENARHKKAWDELYTKTDEILRAKPEPHKPPYQITAQMTLGDRQTRHMIEAAWWGAHVRRVFGTDTMDKEIYQKLHTLFSNYSMEVAKEDTTWFENVIRQAFQKLAAQQRQKARSAAATDRQLDRMEREITNQRMIDAMEDTAAATRELKNEVIMNQMLSDQPPPTIFCRHIGGTTICN